MRLDGLVTGFPLMPEGKDIEQVRFCFMAIESHIARLAKGDDQFAQRGMAFDRAPDEWRGLELKQGLLDDPTRPLGRLRRMPTEEYALPLNTGRRPLCDDQ